MQHTVHFLLKMIQNRHSGQCAMCQLSCWWGLSQVARRRLHPSLSWFYLYLPHFSFFKYFKLFYGYAAAAAAKSLQSCPTLCDPKDGSPPGPLVPGILQAPGCLAVGQWSHHRDYLGHDQHYTNLYIKDDLHTGNGGVTPRWGWLLLLLSHFSHVQLCATP